MLDFFSENSLDLMNNMKVPSTYYYNTSIVYRYWFRSLLHKIDSSIIFKNLPEGFSNDFFMFCLWVRGYVLFFKTDRKDLQKYGENGIVFQPCYVSGYDFYYQPTKATVSNKYLKFKYEYELGTNAALLKLTPDFMGVLDIIDYYASKLSSISEAIDMSIINSKMGLIATAENEAQAATLKAIYDKVQKGETLIVYDDLMKDNDEIIPRKEPFQIWIQELKKNYILTDQLQDMQTILDSFYTEIGLPVAVEKKERLVTTEADFAVAQSQARISCWIETIKESLEVINKMFNTNIEVDYASNNDNSSNRSGAEQKNSSEEFN